MMAAQYRIICLMPIWPEVMNWPGPSAIVIIVSPRWNETSDGSAPKENCTPRNPGNQDRKMPISFNLCIMDLRGNMRKLIFESKR